LQLWWHPVHDAPDAASVRFPERRHAEESPVRGANVGDV